MGQPAPLKSMHIHDHQHGHEHRHDRHEHGRRALRLAFALTALLMIVEFVGGYLTNSLALVADAGHMLTDAAALGLSLFAVWFSSRPATPERTYGYFRVEILSALINGVTLVVLALFISFEAYQRLAVPPPVLGGWMLVISVLGLASNLVCAGILHGSRDGSLNVRGAFLHVVGDILGSVGAIAASILILGWGWYAADPIISVAVSLLILFSAWRLVRESVGILLEGAPAHVNVLVMKEELGKVDGVDSIHDLHVWTLTSGVHAMSCHAVVCGPAPRPGILEKLSEISKTRFNIPHTTIQLEEENRAECLERICH
ncbi:MAG: cation diffusion facilitator family transporter [Acidobacteriota bacterium]